MSLLQQQQQQRFPTATRLLRRGAVDVACNPDAAGFNSYNRVGVRQRPGGCTDAVAGHVPLLGSSWNLNTKGCAGYPAPHLWPKMCCGSAPQAFKVGSQFPDGWLKLCCGCGAIQGMGPRNTHKGVDVSVVREDMHSVVEEALKSH